MDKSIKQGMNWLLARIAHEWEDLHERVQADMAEQEKIQKQEKAERSERVRKLREERWV